MVVGDGDLGVRERELDPAIVENLPVTILDVIKAVHQGCPNLKQRFWMVRKKIMMGMMTTTMMYLTMHRKKERKKVYSTQ